MSESRFDPERVRMERECFVILQHVYTMTEADPTGSISCSRVASDLGFLDPQCGDRIEDLIWIGLLRWTTPGLEVSITRRGIDYVERLARRRKSVRLTTIPSHLRSSRARR